MNFCKLRTPALLQSQDSWHFCNPRTRCLDSLHSKHTCLLNTDRPSRQHTTLSPKLHHLLLTYQTPTLCLPGSQPVPQWPEGCWQQRCHGEGELHVSPWRCQSGPCFRLPKLQRDGVLGAPVFGSVWDTQIDGKIQAIIGDHQSSASALLTINGAGGKEQVLCGSRDNSLL